MVSFSLKINFQVSNRFVLSPLNLCIKVKKESAKISNRTLICPQYILFSKLFRYGTNLQLKHKQKCLTKREKKLPEAYNYRLLRAIIRLIYITKAIKILKI